MVVQPIKDQKTIDNMSEYLKQKNIKYFVMWKIGINTALRVSDIIKLKVSDVRNKDGTIKNHITLRTTKTKKVNQYYITDSLKKILKNYTNDMEEYQVLIPAESRNNKTFNKAISRQWAWNIINQAGAACGINDRIGTHTMRKTTGYHLYKKTKDIVKVQKVLKHSGRTPPAYTLVYICIASEEIESDVNSLDL
jgi:integrase